MSTLSRQGDGVRAGDAQVAGIEGRKSPNAQLHVCLLYTSFRRIRTPKKWMRAHRDFEWPDSYKPENLDDIRRFFDRYCKEIHNGWEMTPRVRLDVMDGYD